MDIAVTDGSGRLGRVLIEHLLDNGHILRSLDWTPPPEPYPSGRPVRFIHVDHTHISALAEVLRGCEAVIHLAAYPGPEGHPLGVV